MLKRGCQGDVFGNMISAQKCSWVESQKSNAAYIHLLPPPSNVQGQGDLLANSLRKIEKKFFQFSQLSIKYANTGYYISKETLTSEAAATMIRLTEISDK